jgi:hypothetical protein
LIIDDYFIVNRIKNLGKTVVLKQSGVEIKELPSEDSKTLYIHMKEMESVCENTGYFYVIDELNIKDRTVLDTKIIGDTIPGWNKIACEADRGMLIGWIKQGEFELLADIQKRGDEEKEKNESLEYNEKKLAQVRLRKNFKGFSFRGILMAISLEEQMFSCEILKQKKEKGMCYEKRGYADGFEITNLPELGFFTSTSVYLIDNKVEKIVTSLSDDGADNMLSLLKKKYGKPKVFNKDIVQNRMGAKFIRFMASWYIRNCELILTNRAGKVDEGILLITTKKYNQHENAREKKDKKKALDNL